MKQNLNSIVGRISAAKMAELQRFLADRWHPHALDDHKEADDPMCPICSNNP